MHAQNRSDTIPLNDPQVSDLFVPHYDCSHQNNLQQFSLIHVQPCSQAPLSLQNTRVLANVCVRAKSKRLEAWTYEACIERDRFVCGQSDYKYCHHDHTD